MKQKSAVEWLVKKIIEMDGQEISYRTITVELVDQAKEMEKQQIIDAFYQCGRDNFEHIKVINRSATEYYNETYGSKGSDDTSSKTEISEHPKTIIDEIDAILFQLEFGDRMRVFELFDKYINESYPSEQTEISDEEIDKQAEPIEQGIHRMFFKTGAKWYREQLKNNNQNP